MLTGDFRVQLHVTARVYALNGKKCLIKVAILRYDPTFYSTQPEQLNMLFAPGAHYKIVPPTTNY